MVSILCCMRCFSCRGRGKRHNKRAERKREGKQNKADSYKEHEQKVWVEQEIQEWGIHRRAGTEWGQHRSPGLAARGQRGPGMALPAAATWQLHVYSSLITAFSPNLEQLTFFDRETEVCLWQNDPLLQNKQFEFYFNKIKNYRNRLSHLKFCYQNL